MIRFPNPGSDIEHLVDIFISLYRDLSSQHAFNLDDMSMCMVNHNLVASCGRTGSEALKRSSRADRSRDPLYNQSKMYSEVYRLLGWITSLPDTRLSFQFTLLGAHIAIANSACKKLASYCILGICYPSPTLDIINNVSLRPFKTFLFAMRDLGGYISRDEMIYGPMHLHDDRDQNEYNSMIESIKQARTKKNLSAMLASKLIQRGITYTTATNYTRFPLAVLKWCGWTKTIRKKVYSKSEPFQILTPFGYHQITELAELFDYRRADLNNSPVELRRPILATCFYRMLERGGFDLSPLNSYLSTEHSSLTNNGIDTSRFLFSPMQELTPSEISSYKAFSPIVCRSSKNDSPPFSISTVSIARPTHSDIAVFHAALIKRDITTSQLELSKAWDNAKHNIKGAVENFVSEHSSDNKDTFYPLIAKLFTLSGFPCETSRNGVNYQRADATITLENGLMIPVEIKSPGEELTISVKAIRQAVENRIILLSRQPQHSRRDLTSLVVGFHYPNERAEANELLYDIKNAFGFNIGIFDFTTVTKLAFEATFNKKFLPQNDLENVHGFFSVNTQR